MRFGFKPFFINAVFIVLFTGSTAVSSASFDYLYVEASEGNSSGGHSALQFGDEVYHYQHHDSGLIRLLRQDKQPFHFLYRFLQNRRIHLSHIEVSEETFNKLREHFKMQFLAQDQQFRQLNQIHRDRVLLHRLLQPDAHEALPDTDSSSVLRLNGAGLFYDEKQLEPPKKIVRKLNGAEARASQMVETLRELIAQTYGQDFLLYRREQIIHDIKIQTPVHWPVGQEILSKDNFPAAINSFADSVEDDWTALVAIKVLMEKQPLRPDAFFMTGFAVSQEERQILEKLRDQLVISTVKSVNSGRPDWGYAVLVNIARLLAVDFSIQLGQWVFIDDFAVDSEWVSADQFARYAEQMQTHINDALADLALARKTLLDNDGLTETGYSRLEMSANRYFELLKGRQHKAVRYRGESALPTRSIALPDWIAPELTQQQLKTALAELGAYENRLHDELKARYRYNLITRNCVTELFRMIDRAWLQQINVNVGQSKLAEQVTAESTKRLGGNISVTYNFIPFVSFQSVQEHYKVTGNAVLNSYRGQKLEELYARNNALMTAMRESNTLTSTLYTYNPNDAFFIFFTDDNLALRPLFGLFNTVAGMGQTAVGLFSWPFDSGKNLESGATGILMSLPELFFFNMRKGSYKYLSYHQFAQQEK
ncbi:MAG: hypothetical protein PHG00_05525 [Methylococcales bacterium]|nr:hypothetical protein [Methylococcales bacterium]